MRSDGEALTPRRIPHMTQPGPGVLPRSGPLCTRATSAGLLVPRAVQIQPVEMELGRTSAEGLRGTGADEEEDFLRTAFPDLGSQ